MFIIFSQYRKTKEVITITRPHAISEYNTYIGGVDMADRLIAHYPHGIKSKKWYLRVFFHLLNVSLVNAWLCYRKSVDGKMDLLSSKSSVANTLIAKGLCDTKKRERLSSMSPNNTPPLKKKK
ncbi:piggyBac transposable element-derived protein 3-like [Homalodisca vitripennis]|uniref:piggyBac transposable element-derived protein 3-like n=1 Tax=Homalodisca vitripennis TaxID=197043 RepID=UPI001EEA08A3|nr:piggyBac transposable element-derived protein 3-like [Homalodisca vitripennis]